MPTITGRSNTGLFGAMLTVGRSWLGCMVSSRLAGVLRGGVRVGSNLTPRRRRLQSDRSVDCSRNRCYAMSVRPTLRVRHAGEAAPRSLRRCASDENAREDVMTIAAERRRWPAEGLTRVPYWVYSDRDVYEEEQARIFRGSTWHFLCLEAELPNPNNYCRSSLGAMP